VNVSSASAGDGSFVRAGGAKVLPPGASKPWGASGGLLPPKAPHAKPKAKTWAISHDDPDIAGSSDEDL
jgi:hypothetical protein